MPIPPAHANRDVLNVQVFDPEQLLEIVLTAELTIRASKARNHLTQAQIDRILGVSHRPPIRRSDTPAAS